MSAPIVDELVYVLKRSFLPNVIVEGVDDVMICRWFEEWIGIRKVNFLQCGGRTTLLNVYDRSSEFSHLKTAFLADRDMWLFTAIPAQYSNIIWTEGYSIENDLYADSTLENLLDRNEKAEHSLVLQSLIEWFAFEVQEFRSGRTAETSVHPNEIVPIGDTGINDKFISDRGFAAPDNTTVDEIKANYQLKLRGHTIFQLLARYLSASKRKSKFSIKNLYEIAFKAHETHLYMDRLKVEIERKLS